MLLILFFHTFHWFYSYHSGLVKLEENERAIIHKAIMNRARSAFIAYVIVVGCCFYSSYLALCGTILMHIIFSFTGFIEMLYTVLRKKIKSIGHNSQLVKPELAPGAVDEVGDTTEPPGSDINQ
jgi:hypothetical protein